MHADDASAKPVDGGESGRSGLAGECLRGAIHDLRGTLNTVSILHEVLRTQLAGDRTGRGATDADEALAGAGRAVRDLDRMLGHLRDVAATCPIAPEAVALGPALHAAARRAGADGPANVPSPLAVASRPAHLAALLDRWLACCRAVLADGATLRVDVAVDGANVRLEATGSTARTALPTIVAARRLPSTADAMAGWFALHCAASGAGGELALRSDGDPFVVALSLPLTDPSHPEGAAAC